MTGPRGPPQGALIGVVLVVLLLAVFGVFMLFLVGGPCVFSNAPFLCVPVIFVVLVVLIFLVQGAGRRTIAPPPPIQQPMMPAVQQAPVALSCQNCAAPPTNLDRFRIATS